MSVVDLPRQDGGPPDDLGRTPPQDVAAEQCVLGGMLLSKDAIADVVEVLRGTTSTGRPTSWSTTPSLDLYGRGEPADAVTVVGRADRSAASSAGSAARRTCTR